MKAIEFLYEASTLGSLGVDKKGISSIHSNLRLQHDATFEPIKNKKEAKEALLANKAIVAVNDEGDAYGFGFYSSPMSGGTEIVFGQSSQVTGWGRVSSLGKALAKVKGRGYKFYATVKGSQHDDKYDRHARTPSMWDSKGATQTFLRRVDKVYSNLIKSDAKKGYQQIRKHLMKLIDKDDGPNDSFFTPSHKDMNQVKGYMVALQKISKNGLNSWNAGVNYGSKGTDGAMEDFFPGTYSYMMNSAVEDFQKDEKLAMQKFVKYLRSEIKSSVLKARSGDYHGRSNTALDYKDAREADSVDESASKDPLPALLRKAGYSYAATHHQPRSERHEDKVWALETIINDAGYTREKAPDSSEYQFQYDVDGTTIVFNYRFGAAGLLAWWIK